MAVEAGPRYRVLEKLGQGGMGVVFRAEDTLLHRPVALKLVASGRWPEGHVRTHLLAEARASASLNHPNICTVYDVGEWQGEPPSDREDLARSFAPGTPYIAMELVEGRPLSLLLTSGPLRLSEVLDYSVQIADGLAEAHSCRIVHRDLKPHNVMVTEGGRAKILDFGLAAPDLGGGTEDLDSRASTLSVRLGEKAIRGTVPYMSPEQAAGRTVDARSDVFSFGVMLYEMASGSRPFGGDSVTTILAKILEAEPEPLADTRPQLPEELVRIVDRCLKKKPPDRYNDTRDLVADIKQLQVGVSSGSIRRRVRPRRKRLTWGLGVVAGLGLLVTGGLVLRQTLLRRSPLPPRHIQVTYNGSVFSPALAPDGRFIVYRTAPYGLHGKVVLEEIGGRRAVTLLEGRAFDRPTWSADGSEILVAGIVNDEMGTYLVPRLGGTPRRFEFKKCLAWSPDGSRFAGLDPVPLTITDKRTGDTTKLSPAIPPKTAGVPVVGIDWSPRGSWLVYYTYEGQRTVLVTVGTDGSRPTKIAEDITQLFSPRCAPGGDAVYYLRIAGPPNELWKVPVSPETGHPRGAPRLVATGLPSWFITISRDGKRLLYSKENSHSNLWRLTVDASGRPAFHPLTSGTVSDGWPRVSPDGTRIVFTRLLNDAQHVYVMPIEGGQARQVTQSGSQNMSPAWSPDGLEIAYLSLEEGSEEAIVYKIGAQGGTPRRFARARPGGQWLDWAPGSRIMYPAPGVKNVLLLDPVTEEETPLLRKDLIEGSVYFALFSPSGGRIALLTVRRREGRRQGFLSVVPLDTGERTQVAEDAPFLVGWAPDERGLIAHEREAGGQRLVFIPLTGGAPRTLALLPSDRLLGDWALLRGGSGLVVSIEKVVSDAWLLENFDPDVR